MSRKRGRVAYGGRNGGATTRACTERLVNRPAAQADRDVARIERVARADRIDGEVAPDVELVPGAIGVEGACDRRRTDDNLARPTSRGAARQSLHIVRFAEQFSELALAGQQQIASFDEGHHELDSPFRSPQAIAQVRIDDAKGGSGCGGGKQREAGGMWLRTDQRGDAGDEDRAGI